MYGRINRPLQLAGADPKAETPLDALDEATNWYPVAHLENLVVELEGVLAGDVIEVRGTLGTGSSNGSGEKPSDSDLGHQLGSDITADGVYPIEENVDWIKLVLADATGGGTIVGRYAGDPVHN